MIAIGTRARTLPASPHIVWGSLATPTDPGSRRWLTLVDDERMPTVLAAERPTMVLWSSLWPARPHTTESGSTCTPTERELFCASPSWPWNRSRTGVERAISATVSTRFSSPTCGIPTANSGNPEPSR